MAPPIGRIYHKNFDIAGNKFTVQVCFQGNIPSGHLAQLKYTWLYNLLVNNTVIEMGQWYDLQGREPSNEEVCDGLAQFWHDSKKIHDAQVLGDDENQKAIDEVVERCAQEMFRYYMQDESFDYDIISAYMDEHGWEVVLMPNLLTAKKDTPYGKKQSVLSFKQFPQHKGQYMMVYDLVHSVYTKL